MVPWVIYVFEAAGKSVPIKRISPLMKQEPGTWLTTGQAAKLCSVTPDTVLKWIKKGSLEAVRTAGGHYRIRREDLGTLLTDRHRSAREQHQPLDEVPQHLRCWEYFSRGGVIRDECQACVVYRARAAWCFQMATLGPEVGYSGRFCQTSCEDCVYFRRMSGRPTNVLVVTSDHDLVHRLSEADHEGIALRFARNAYEASAVVQGFVPAFAVVDQDALRGGEDGLLESLAYDPRLPGLKIIVAVARGKARASLDAMSHIVACVIEKPFGASEIAGVIGGFPVESFEAESLARLGNA